MQADKNNILTGFIAAQLFAIATTLGTKYLLGANLNTADVLISSEFILIPLVMGIISAYFWRKGKVNTTHKLLHSLIHLLILCAWSWAILGEGYICLIIVSPLIYVCLLVGIISGYYMFRRKNNTLNFSVLGLIALFFVADVFSKHEFERMVGDTIIINAPPAKVWPYVVAYEPIEAAPDYWLFNIGMPRPIASTVSDYKVGANRKCVFHNGYVFDEVMTVYEPEKNLTFDITHQPKDPEIMGHIDILRVQFGRNALPIFELFLHFINYLYNLRLCKLRINFQERIENPGCQRNMLQEGQVFYYEGENY